MRAVKNQTAEEKTLTQYNEVIAHCFEIYKTKATDYGTSWRVFRLPSLIDQIFIKASRIRNIDQPGHNKKVDEEMDAEFMGIVNYGIIGMIQLSLGDGLDDELSKQSAEIKFLEQAEITRKVMLAKNHDYGEAWREMFISSFTDMILIRIRRLRQIIRNDGITLISEGLDSHFTDIINYAVFALIKIHEENS